MWKKAQTVVMGVVLALPSVSAAAGTAAKLDVAVRESWPAHKTWDADVEAQYSSFVATIGRKVAAGGCRTLSACLNDATINPLYEETDKALRFHADCADVPYILRAYFAYRHDLPFAHASGMQGRGRDARYFRDARPRPLRSWRDWMTPRQLLEGLSNVVHSGFFRTAPAVQDADFYQTAITRTAVRPGTMFYDPNGHVLVVYEVRSDGEVLTFDGHPDGYLTHGPLTEQNVRGGVTQGGGFKNFRPICYKDNRVVQLDNAAIADFGGLDSFDRRRYQVEGRPVSFHTWVHAQLAADPLSAASSVAAAALTASAR